MNPLPSGSPQQYIAAIHCGKGGTANYYAAKRAQTLQVTRKATPYILKI
jgi:hypothetical protein